MNDYSVSSRMLLWGAGLALAAILGCISFHCDDPEPLESGDYDVVGRSYGPDDQPWLIGTQLTVDREAGLAFLRYTRDGTTYEVQYSLFP